MIIKLKRLYKDAILPKYAHPGDAGLDLCTTENRVLSPGQKHGFKTGIAIEIPNNYAGLIWARSGLGIKHGLMILGGVVDSSYRGEIIVGIFNSSKETFKIEKGDKIAQMLLQPVIQADIKEVIKLSNSSRGKGGLGSTGRK